MESKNKTTPRISLVYSTTENRVIGKQGRLVAHIPEDLKRFKSLTDGGVVIMGSATYFSLPGSARPLKNRINIVLTRDASLKLPGVKIYHDLKQAIADHKDRNIWIIGGGNVLKQAIGLADEIRLTLIHQELAGDTVSPVINAAEWKITQQSEHMTHDKFTYHYIDYRRRRSHDDPKEENNP